ncbi:BICD family-like cargo adapter 1 isoform X2, partial [Tachysurus ichikawai]
MRLWQQSVHGMSKTNKQVIAHKGTYPNNDKSILHWAKFHATQNEDRANETLGDSQAMEVKLAVTAELQSLKQELGEKGHPRLQDEEMLSVLKEQVARLTEREQSLEQRLETVCKENAGLRDSVSSLYTQLALQEQQINTQTQQLAEAWQEVELRKDKVQDLQSQIEELQEEVSLQRTADGNTSLLSEMERSLEGINWSQDKEQ